MRIDLNCDMGELALPENQDAALMPLVSSANIACGAHAGDTDLMIRTVALAMDHDVAIGAHPGYDDRANFGRLPMHLSADALRDLILRQLDALAAVVHRQGGRLHHMKPHGALYNQASADPTLAGQLADILWEFDPTLVLVGGASGALIEAGARRGLTVAREGFADRRYRDNGQLVSRQEPGAVLDAADSALAQAQALVTGQPLISWEGHPLTLTVDTLCLHGDGAQALPFARAIRHWLDQQGINVLPPQRP
ncbi:LamB/YcsF family protein [Marinobacter hydrocarbonoclasticus]|nr:LamB/YcsF family protein [Marinobacter nauticus]